MNKRQTSDTYRRQRTVVEGNTVRKLSAAPQREREQRQRKEKRKLDRAAKANRERALRLNPGYLLFLTFAVMITVGVCVAYIWLQSDVNSRMKHIASLESKVLDIRTNNDADLKRIETSVDIEMVKAAALNELGMVYPGPEQIVYFEVDTNDYMNQYQDIPDK